MLIIKIHQQSHLNIFFSSYPIQWKWSIAAQSFTSHGISEKCFH